MKQPPHNNHTPEKDTRSTYMRRPSYHAQLPPIIYKKKCKALAWTISLTVPNTPIVKLLVIASNFTLRGGWVETSGQERNRQEMGDNACASKNSNLHAEDNRVDGACQRALVHNNEDSRTSVFQGGRNATHLLCKKQTPSYEDLRDLRE